MWNFDKNWENLSLDFTWARMEIMKNFKIQNYTTLTKVFHLHREYISRNCYEMYIRLFILKHETRILSVQALIAFLKFASCKFCLKKNVRKNVNNIRCELKNLMKIYDQNETEDIEKCSILLEIIIIILNWNLFCFLKKSV